MRGGLPGSGCCPGSAEWPVFCCARLRGERALSARRRGLWHGAAEGRRRAEGTRLADRPGPCRSSLGAKPEMATGRLL
eukprot:9542116-Heterocapsa_arctica.AAC.1